MPYVNVKVAGSLDRAQKKKIAEGVSRLLQEVAAKPPSSTYVVFEEIPRDSWAIGSKLLSE